MTGEASQCEGPDAEARALAHMGALSQLPKRHNTLLAPILENEFGLGIVERFRTVVRKAPDNLAIWTTSRQITYLELDRASDALAKRLMAKGLCGSGPIALGTRNEIGHVIGILGILKAGGYYLPISHLLPVDRRREILAMVMPKAAVATHSAEADYLWTSGGLEFADIADAESAVPSETVLPPPAETAFVLFTSGSTGTPKGVVQSQSNLLRNTSWQTEALSINSSDRFSQLHADGTMGAVRATLNALLNGATLCPFDIASNSLTSFGAWISQAKPTILHTAASFFRVFANALSEDGQFVSVRLMILGGEAVTGDDFQLFKKRFPAESHLCTGLGSTETTTVRMMCLPHGSRPILHNGRLPLGFAVPGTTISLVDSVPDESGHGTIGEMALQSTTLFPGYWPAEAVTARRTFRMGDLGLRTCEGVLYHMGRKDHQVKVNGNRVDLLEIERAVVGIPGVSEACCIAETVQGSNAKLLLFIRREAPTALTVQKVRHFLRRWFPAYMQPGSIFLLDSLPRIAGGKIDIGQLRDGAKHFRTSEPLEKLVDGRTGSDRDLIECFINTSYPFLLQDGASVANLEDLDTSAMQIDSLSPRSPSGKREYGSLPDHDAAPPLPALSSGAAPSAPDPGEIDIIAQTVIAIWGDVLQRKAAWDPDLGFDDLGGDSLASMRMIFQVEHVFGIELDQVSFAEINSVRTLTAKIKSIKSGDNQRREREARAEGAPESDATVQNFLPEARRILDMWPGEPVGDSGLIRVLNKAGRKPPLVWCFNDSSEPESLAAALGSDQPLYILRSAHGLIDREFKEWCEPQIAAIYARAIFTAIGAQRVAVGGNCQGSRIALMLANTLLQLKMDVASALLVEPAFLIPYPRRVMLMPGSNYSRINPIFRYANPHLGWNRYFRDYRVAVIRGGHGEYFRPENVGSLAGLIEGEMDAALQLPSLRVANTEKTFELAISAVPQQWRAGTPGVVEVRLAAGGGSNLVLNEESGITVSFRWECEVPSQELPRPASGFPSQRVLRDGKSAVERFSIQPPKDKGRYVLVVQLCEEGAEYFGDQVRVSIDLCD